MTLPSLGNIMPFLHGTNIRDCNRDWLSLLNLPFLLHEQILIRIKNYNLIAIFNPDSGTAEGGGLEGL